MQKTKCTAIVLAAGQGKRMGTSVQKQYLEIQDKPVLFYSLNAFQESEIIDDIILVVGEGQKEYCQKEFVEKFGFSKVSKIVYGGSERYFSVWNGLCEIKDSEYVYIHDGARPFVTGEIIKRAFEGVQAEKACVVGMPVKDTIKIADNQGYAEYTPNRSLVWMIQTPQVFELSLIKKAYAKLMELKDIPVTDDAMVVEQMLGIKVKLIEGSYENIKITTPEDLFVADSFLKKMKK